MIGISCCSSYAPIRVKCIHRWRRAISWSVEPGVRTSSSVLAISLLEKRGLPFCTTVTALWQELNGTVRWISGVALIRFVVRHPRLNGSGSVPRPMLLNHYRAGDGEPLVLLHGIGSHWQMWEPVLPMLTDRHDVIALDLPGFGGAPG